MAQKKQTARKQPNPQPAKKQQGGKSAPLVKEFIGNTGIPRKYLIPGVLFFLCFVLYGNTLKNDYTLDDDIYTRRNAFVQKGFSDIGKIFDKGSLYGFNGNNESNYRPLVLLDFMAEVAIFKLNPHVSHFFNVLFFAFCCILLYYVMRRIFREYNKLIPLAVVLLFMFHPIHTEVVASIKSRDEILGLLFGLASFYFIFRYADSGMTYDYMLSLVTFIASILCKEGSIMFIFIIPLLLYYFTSTDLRRIVMLSLPYAGILLVYMLVRSHVLSSITFEHKMEIINNSLMAAKSNMDQLATEIMMMGKYIYMMVVPYPLSWDYSYNQVPNVPFSDIKAIGSLLLYMAMGGYAIWDMIKRKSIYSFAILFYLITMFLTSNIMVKVGSTFAERFLFTPSVGYCMVIPLFITRAIKTDPKHAVWRNKNTFYGVLGLILIVYAAILIPRNRDWKDNLSLFKAGVIASPNSARTHSALAKEYRTQGEMAQEPAQKRAFFALSLEQFHKSLDIYKDPDTYYNMGVTFYEDGMQDSALYVYEKTLAGDSTYSMAYNNIGAICCNKKDFNKAVIYFTKAYNEDKNNIQYVTNLGIAYQNIGNATEAIKYYSKVLQIDPHNAGVANNLSRMYMSTGMQYMERNELDSAYDDFTVVLKYEPGSANAYGNIGVIFYKKGEYIKAREYFQKALEIDPQNKVFLNDMQQLNMILQKASK